MFLLTSTEFIYFSLVIFFFQTVIGVQPVAELAGCADGAVRPAAVGVVPRAFGCPPAAGDSTRFPVKDVYNHHIPQQALQHQSPIQALKQWQMKQPELFHRKVVNHAGPDK